MSFKVKGCSVYSQGDDTAFRLEQPADEVLAKIETATPGEFLAFTSIWTNAETKEEAHRTLYVRADKVWAVAPYLTDDQDDE